MTIKTVRLLVAADVPQSLIDEHVRAIAASHAATIQMEVTVWDGRADFGSYVDVTTRLYAEVAVARAQATDAQLAAWGRQWGIANRSSLGTIPLYQFCGGDEKNPPPVRVEFNKRSNADSVLGGLNHVRYELGDYER